VCLYVSSPLTEGVPYLVHPTPGAYSKTFFQYYYNDSVDYSLGQNSVPNSQYHGNSHPSEVLLAYDSTLGDNVMVDSILPLLYLPSVDANTTQPPPSPPSVHARSVQAGAHIPVSTTLAEQTALWGWSTCHWIRDCDPSTEKIGTPCSATLSNVTYNGFCFESNAGSLECGHATAFDARDGTNPMAVATARSPNVLPSSSTAFVAADTVFGSITATTRMLPLTTYRCERGAAATSAGSHVGKRLLVAGCMISADAHYSELAEVHVPEYCAAPADYLPGCMFEDAENYNPYAKQPTNCHYRTLGCTSPTAVNYNSEASVDDASCIEAVPGCTISPLSYDGVDASTPSYKSGFYGSARANVGKVNETVYGGPAVTNYLATANVLASCTVAVEGCMDPLARNYNPAATVNTATWCIPNKQGCMMPYRNAAGTKFSTLAENRIDGLAANFDPNASVHVTSMCILERVGCTDSSKHNYDPHATIDSGLCYDLIEGCLNPQAKNFNCKYRGVYEPCLNTGVSLHANAVCEWVDQPPMPPAAPPPPLPPGKAYESKPATTTAWLSPGAVEDYASKLAGLVTFFAETTGAPASDVTVDVQPGSVQISATVVFATMDAANAAASSISTTLGDSPASAAAALGVEVQSMPQTESKTIQVEVEATPAAAPVGRLVGPIAGGAGGLVLLLLIAGVAYYVRRKRQSALVEVSDPADDGTSYNQTTTRSQAKQAWAEDPDDED